MRLAREQGMDGTGGALAAADDGRLARACRGIDAATDGYGERNTAESYAGQIQALLDRPDATPVLPTIHVPTLLLSGTNDTWSPVSQHEEMLAPCRTQSWSRLPKRATWRRWSSLRPWRRGAAAMAGSGGAGRGIPADGRQSHADRTCLRPPDLSLCDFAGCRRIPGRRGALYRARPLRPVPPRRTNF